MPSGIQFAAHKLPLPATADRRERIQYRKAMLFRVLNMKSAVAVVGSGCTISLGYPSWSGFACGLIEQVIRDLGKLRSAAPELRRFEEFHKQFDLKRGKGAKSAEPSKPSSESLMFFISACQGIGKRVPQLEDWTEKSYRSYIEKTFDKNKGRKRKQALRDNPCKVLLDLPIYRFITTNYDCELEWALSKIRGIPPEELGLEGDLAKTNPGRLRSFTQSTVFAEQLAHFALARITENRNMIFHCHGRYDDLNSIIASEADYQRWYVSELKGAGPTFRQTIELLFESNPLLFVGYGMAEYDLLRPLRQLGALDPKRKEGRALFAILPSEGKEAEVHFEEYLFERYGLHVIPYQRKRNERQETALCRFLRQLNSEFATSSDDWLRKPCVRQPPSPSRARSVSAPLMIPSFYGKTLQLVDFIPVANLKEKILAQLKETQILCIVGPGGTGKTWNMLNLIRELNESREYEGLFYWNAHYTNEAFTVLEQAVSYFDPKNRYGGTRQERLLACLREGRHLIVVDGCERLLRPGSEAWQGTAYGAGFAQMLRTTLAAARQGDADSEFTSRIIFSGRLWPSELIAGTQGEKKCVAVMSTERVSTAALLRADTFSPASRGEVSALCSLLRGHSYGLLIASQFLRRKPDQMGDLQRRLAAQPPKKRFSAIVSRVLEDLRARHGVSGEEFLRNLALFTEPVLRRTVDVCFRDAAAFEKPRGPVGKLLEELKEDCLVLGVRNAGGKEACVVHASIRNYFARNERGSRSVVLPDFALLGYTGGTNGVDPGSEERMDRIERIFAALCRKTESAPGKEAYDVCRDAYGVLRAQMECSTAARRQDYNSYMRRGIALASLVKQIAPKLWSFSDPNDFKSVCHIRGALFIAELAWLYHDVALALFSEGFLPDAFSVWEQAYEINRTLESTQPYGEFVMESLLNLTHTLIELGQLSDATEYLEEAARLNSDLQDREIASRILGFRAFCEHIRGNLRFADTSYEKAVRNLLKGSNRRAASLFRTLHSGVKIELGAFEEARRLARESRALAEAGDYPDLVAYARLAEAYALVKSGKQTESEGRQGYELVLKESQRMGARALESFARLRLAEISFDQGDAEGSRHLALHALKLANELGLGLLRTRVLVVLARATISSGQFDLGIAYLKIAQQQAQRQQYGLRLRDVERHLQEYGILTTSDGT